MKKLQIKNQTGQTLIETVVAITILVTALVSSLALTIYVLSNSNRNQSEIIATYLAREGVDVVRNMRDSNWLMDDYLAQTGNAAYGLHTAVDASDTCGALGATNSCYPKAFSDNPNSHFDLNPTTASLNFNNVDKSWCLSTQTNCGPLNFKLYVQGDGSYTTTAAGARDSGFRRKIVLVKSTPAGYYNTSDLWRLEVTSIVGWQGKGCTAMAGDDPSTTNCKIQMKEYLTNWKNYY
jgi:type II secretory pathway pseudopilin PulG